MPTHEGRPSHLVPGLTSSNLNSATQDARDPTTIMTQEKPDASSLPAGADGIQTLPTEPRPRLTDADICLKPCDARDAEKIVWPSTNRNGHIS